ncbi:hypothetical protein CAL7716_038370 [Calothrix sp. PCC 7716]|nr:hypothetical protein CAL7716_038370 [Calothrix sp. PCC 7716]
MVFKKKHKLGFTSSQPFDKDPVCFKVLPGVKDKLKVIPNWQERLRAAVDKLIEEAKIQGD